MAYHEGSFLRGLAVGRMLAGLVIPQGARRFLMHPPSFLKGYFVGLALRRGVTGGGVGTGGGGTSAYNQESFLSGLAAGMAAHGTLPEGGKIPLHYASFVKGILVGRQLRLLDSGGAVPLVGEYPPAGGGEYEKRSFLSGIAVGRALYGVPIYDEADETGGYLRNRYLLAADGSGDPQYDPESIQVVGNRFRLVAREDRYEGEDRTYIGEYRTAEIDQGSLAVLDFDLTKYRRITEFTLYG